MASLKYGCLDPSPKTKEYPVAASQYFQHNGLTAVYLDASGHLTGALTATATLLGMAIIPAGRGNPTNTSDDYWLSSATAGQDKLPVVLAKDNYQFLVPGIITCTAAMIGGAWDMIGVNSASTHYVDLDTSSTLVFIVTDLGVNVKANAAVTDAVVIFNPAKIQAD